jgi:hypothetical protein
METRRIHEGRFASIFSLMRDGREMAKELRHAGAGASAAIRPYVQFVDGEVRCEHTGLRLVDIWRYFRHTWANPYKSVPGRSMMILVRDAAAPVHPVIGIAALSSAVVGHSVRDEFIGWTFEEVVARIAERPAGQVVRWMRRIVDDGIAELFKGDLLEDQTLTLKGVRSPSLEMVARLESQSKQDREKHYRNMQGSDYKQNVDVRTEPNEYWERQARWPLFRAKREQELAALLGVRMVLDRLLGGKPTAAKITEFLKDGEGKWALARLIRKAKSDRVGTAIADLTVCGAIPPYNEVLGGKLVAMLATSPEVVAEYLRRYGKTPSIIASSMAGRRVVRAADLVYISTTSLYGRRPNQYDRIQIPIACVGGGGEGGLRYEFLGETRGIGTFHFSGGTVEAMDILAAQTTQGQRVNSIFGEGVNPRLRKIRDALDELGLSSNEFLDHGAPRLVYGVRLIENLPEYLMAMAKKPQYILSSRRPVEVTKKIAEWWFGRWCVPRLQRADEVLPRIAAHNLIHPIRHGARVPMPVEDPEQGRLFGERGH